MGDCCSKPVASSPQPCYKKIMCCCVKPYDHDLIVIGGGSGGLSLAREARKLGKNVAVCDFVVPTPFGTHWGLGGTCVNVGCIPKRIMHQASLNRESMGDSSFYGWKGPEKATHDWQTLVTKVQEYIQSLNFGYRVALNSERITYYKAYAQFHNKHGLKFFTEFVPGQDSNIFNYKTARHIVIAVGCRPRYMDIPGGRREDMLCITSDDLFSLSRSPGKVLCVGGGYIAVECAGFLSGLGYDSTIMVRSQILREFDKDVAERITESLIERGIKVLTGFLPTEIIKVGEGDVPQLKVIYKNSKTEEVREDIFNTVIMAIGRDPILEDLKLKKAGVKVSKTSGRIKVDASDRTSTSNIFAIGDVAEGRPELTPAAIKAGQLLARRLYKCTAWKKADYRNMPTAVFSPLEYGSFGFTEENAIKKYGKRSVICYQASTKPLEISLTSKQELNYAKLICVRGCGVKEKVVGFHYLGPFAGEFTQGFSMAMQFNPTKDKFDRLLGVHPTNCEIFTEMRTTKDSGEDFELNANFEPKPKTTGKKSVGKIRSSKSNNVKREAIEGADP